MNEAAIANRARAEHLGPDRRRPQVLDTALEIAAQQGLADVTMGNIARRMGVTRPVVYACYPGRGEVLAALLDRETDAVLASLLDLLPPERTGSIEQLFVDGFRALHSTVRERPDSWRIMFGADPDPVLTAAIVAGRERIRGQLATAMRPLLQRWQVADIDVTLPMLVEVFLAICETAVRKMLDDKDAADSALVAETFGKAAYRAMRAKPQ
ncbi:TetR/AcrR family transcriptional regulator [Mycolicibacterium farcinogenes]|nr:TetR/AcrR family transcriptional regulator [Mycolicibacterium farcinogenes]